ncbi:MAG TPA: potassium-transporting ATPase subunit KdpC [Hyphomonadaceae bacterium]|nr:potassium-transporting ATPase subunit KdpC [Hyphomonadaceae bacterium]
MLKHLRPALVLLAIFTILTGLIYPLAMTGIGQALFKRQADGSPIERNGVVVGSSLIGQAFSKPEYFWGRPSAAGKGYDARSSSGSNLGPSSKVLADRIGETATAFGAPAGKIPPDLLTASGSGLDPHISPAAARFQAGRIALARRMPVETVNRLIDEHTEAPSLGFIGEPRINVLELNLALDDLGRTQTQ